jgi:hypothetical protein
MTVETHRLTLRVVVPDFSQRGAAVEVRPLVDGEDILGEVFTEGPGEDPKHLLSADVPLTATTRPREVRLATATCTEGCCGALYVTIRREGDHVVWTGWRNPDKAEVGLLEFRFDAQQYQAEVERATTDYSWEWPARTIARLLETNLAARTDWLSRWECELGFVSALPWEPNEISIFFFHPGRPCRSAIEEGRPWLQFRMVASVSDNNPADQAETLTEQLVAGDPRQAAEVCGGSSEFAAQLGYRWPEQRRA